MGNTTAQTNEKAGGFRGRTVLSFESRRAAEIATLIENLGAARGSRQVELANGRATVQVKLNGESMVSVSAKDLPTALWSVA